MRSILRLKRQEWFNLCEAFLVKGKWHGEFIESRLAAVIITRHVIFKLSAAFGCDSVILNHTMQQRITLIFLQKVDERWIFGNLRFA